MANEVLNEGYGVRAECGDRDSDYELWHYVRVFPDGTVETSVQTFDVGLAAYPPDTLLRICKDLKLETQWDAIRAEIVKRGGWVGPTR